LWPLGNPTTGLAARRFRFKRGASYQMTRPCKAVYIKNKCGCRFFIPFGASLYKKMADQPITE
ncbi:hypothetical protein, partial [Pectobacterium carotovorum]|uniref:hypothetical protein n=1 Tax=Pectobacterium carotovorum TaxID=554 RepID=UPI001CF34663